MCAINLLETFNISFRLEGSHCCHCRLSSAGLSGDDCDDNDDGVVCHFFGDTNLFAKQTLRAKAVFTNRVQCHAQTHYFLFAATDEDECAICDECVCASVCVHIYPDIK